MKEVNALSTCSMQSAFTYEMVLSAYLFSLPYTVLKLVVHFFVTQP